MKICLALKILVIYGHIALTQRPPGQRGGPPGQGGRPPGQGRPPGPQGQGGQPRQQQPPQPPPPQEPPPEENKEKPDCKHTTYNPKGEFESPGFPVQYPNEADCMYRIFTDKIINVSFESFDLENSDGCKYDYLQVLFEATEEDAKPEKCVTRIVLPLPRTTDLTNMFFILNQRVYFEAFDVEETEDCKYDYLQTYFDAMSPDAKPERYCGAGLGKIKGGHLRGKGPLIMAFRSDDSEAKAGYKFKYEIELDGPDPCDSNPCQNEGSCERLVGYYKCHCADGFVGVNCEEDMDDCASYPCENGGQCQDGLNSYTCECINGFTGEICDIDPDPCASNPCQNGGLCVNRIPDFVCSCPRTFMGDICEHEVPTLPPPTTTTPPEVETKPQEVDEMTTASPAAPDTGEDADKKEDTEKSGEKNDESSDGSDGEDDSNKVGMIVAIVTILAIALILAGIFAWYWFKHLRKNNDEQQEKEVTLINMKTRSELGNKGKASSRTTSINVVNSKGGGGKQQSGFLNELQKMSQDIIMEEVHADEKPPQRIMNRQSQENFPPSQQPRYSHQQSAHNPPIKRISIPISPDEVAMMQRSPMSNIAFANPGNQQAPLKISPEDAFTLLNYLKTNEGNQCDLPTALFAVQNQRKNQAASLYPSYQNPPRMLPNDSYNSVHRRQPIASTDESLGSIDLTPEEAADVVNYLLAKSPTHGALNPAEAVEVMRDVRDKKIRNRPSRREKEKTVVLNPQEVANIVNSFRSRKNRDPRLKLRDRHKRNRGFRPYTPILEEDSTADDVRSHHNFQYSESPSENDTIPSPRPTKQKQKHIAYANTIDPDEKVNDWLRASPKRKNGRRPYSATNSNTTETHTVTRNLPYKQRNSKPKKVVENDISLADYDDDSRGSRAIPRTIRQTRVKVPNSKRNSLPVTENKAKSLVEKLVKAPVRSNQNVVAPSLGVKRQNAFLD